MTTELHRLCEVCRDLRFDLATLKRCTAANCVDGIIAGEHTTRVPHQPGLGALESAALNGCHLCSLICSGLEQNTERKEQVAHDDESKQPGQISLVYFLEKETGRENIVAHHDERWVTLHLTEKPSTRCGDPEFASERDLRIGPPDFMIVTRVGAPVRGDHARRHRQDTVAADPSFPQLDYDARELMDVFREVDGHFLASPITMRNGTLERKERTIGWIRADKCEKLTRPPHPLCPCGVGLWEPPLLTKGDTTYLDPDPLSPALIDQIKSWIEMCNEVHLPCRLSEKNKNVLPYRVVDVGPSNGCKDPFLSVGHERLGEYATLSYRWGTTPNMTTTTADVGDKQCKIPLELCPPTIRDGIVLVRKLGIRYLWIDALCILQDSLSDWAEQSALMGQIYYRAMLNIAIDSAQDTLEGFLKQRGVLNVRSCELPSLFGSGGPMKVICPSIPDVQRVVGNGALSKRGWIFQERALSRRILHWTSYEVAWECNAFTATERQPSFCNWPESRWDEIRDVVRRLGSQPRDQTIPDHVSKAREEKPGAGVNYDQWYRLVEKYAERILTKSKDKLPAISGLAAMFQQSIDPRPEYVSGLWAEDLISGLAWEIESRRLPGHSNVRPFLRHHERLKGLSEYRAPSFSWASVDTGVTFMDNEISYFRWNFVPELDVQVLDYASRPRSRNAFGEVSESSIRLRGLGIQFSRLYRRVEEGSGLKAWTPLYKTSRRVCEDHQGSDDDWDLLAPELILLCLRARVDPISEEYVTHWIKKSSLAGRNTHRNRPESKRQRLRSRCRRAFISAKSAIEDPTSSRQQDLLRVGHQFCLMLLPTGTGEGQFYRIGLYVEEYFLLGLSEWKEMTVTVV